MINPIGFVIPAASVGIGALLIRPRRGFFPANAGPQTPPLIVLAQATISEKHTDELEITDHPVEQGAPISDHAFKRPKEVIIQCGWSNSPSGPTSLLSQAVGVAAAVNPILGLPQAIPQTIRTVQSILSGNTPPSQVKAIYDSLLLLQEARVPFDIYTGKFVYKSMLFKTLMCETTKETENSLIITAVCKQVILVTTQVTTLLPNGAVQADPAQTAPSVDRGSQLFNAAPNAQPLPGSLEDACSALSSELVQAQSLLAQSPDVLSPFSGALQQVPSALDNLQSTVDDLNGVIGRTLSVPTIAAGQLFSIPLSAEVTPETLGTLQAAAESLASNGAVVRGAVTQLAQVSSQLPPAMAAFPNVMAEILDSVEVTERAVALSTRQVEGLPPGQPGGTPNNVRMRWNNASSCWVADIADASGEPLASGIPLVTGASLTEQLGYLGFGQLISQTDHDTDAPPTYSNLGTTGHLYFNGTP